MSLQYALLLLLSMLSMVAAHMEMSYPIPMNSRFDKSNKNPDYNLKTPLAADGSQFPCRGYQKETWPLNEIPLKPGIVEHVTLVGEAFHVGGSCQLSLSRDNGETFRVIQSFIGGCPPSPGPITLEFTLPDFVPGGRAILAWTWLNEVGNREFYMNCAAVKVDNGPGDIQRFNTLPGIWVANQKSVNSCSTKEKDIPVFAHSGANAVYGAGMSASSTKLSADCEVPKRRDSSLDNPTSGQSDQSGQRQGAPLVMAEISIGASGTPSGGPMSPLMSGMVSMGDSESANNSIALPSDSCESVMTFTVTSTTTSRLYSSTGPTTLLTSLSGLSSFDGSIISPPPATAQTPLPLPSSPTQSFGPSPLSSSLPYVPPQELARYLPCNPGSFLCGDPHTFYTCDQSAGGWTWLYPRRVAEGMMCLPSLDPNAPGTAQQPGSAAGFFRSDLYVRERLHGDCAPDGSIGCLNNGKSWMICDHGGWVEMGPVADGTQCIDGSIRKV